MFNFTAEELRRTTENWPVYKGSKMKKRRGLGPNNLLGGDMTTSFMGSWDTTPIEELYPSVIDTFMVNVKVYTVYR